MPVKPRLDVPTPFLDKSHWTERCIAEQLERLADDFDIRVYSSRVEDTDLARIHWRRVAPLPGPHLTGFLWWFLANSLLRWFDRKRRGTPTDLVYTPGINCLDADVISVHIVFAEFYSRVKSKLRLFKNPVSSWPVLIHRRLYYHLICMLERRIYSRPEVCLVAISRMAADDLKRYFHRTGNIPVVYHGCDLEKFSTVRRSGLRAGARAALGLAEQDFAILLVGNDWQKKGLQSLLEAAVRLAGQSLRILVVGNDNPAAFRGILKQEALIDRVQFLPPRSDVEFYYAAADLYAGPSLEDAFALPPLEAMACGVPVIVSRRAGVSEIVHHGEDGIILEDPEDSATLAKWIEKVMTDAEFCRVLSENAARTARSYTWEKNAAEMKAIFDQILRSRQSTTSPQ